MDYLLVCKFLFGWVVFGGKLEEISDLISILYVKYVLLIDLMDFWIMEIMGVVVKFCVCDVDKLI